MADHSWQDPGLRKAEHHHLPCPVDLKTLKSKGTRKRAYFLLQLLASRWPQQNGTLQWAWQEWPVAMGATGNNGWGWRANLRKGDGGQWSGTGEVMEVGSGMGKVGLRGQYPLPAM